MYQHHAYRGINPFWPTRVRDPPITHSHESSLLWSTRVCSGVRQMRREPRRWLKVAVGEGVGVDMRVRWRRVGVEGWRRIGVVVGGCEWRQVAGRE